MTLLRTRPPVSRTFSAKADHIRGSPEGILDHGIVLGEGMNEEVRKCAKDTRCDDVFWWHAMEIYLLKLCISGIFLMIMSNMDIFSVYVKVYVRITPQCYIQLYFRESVIQIPWNQIRNLRP